MPLIRHRRAPCGARPFLVGNYFHTHFISIHAPLAGRDFLFIRRTSAPSYFNPRAPCGARRVYPHAGDRAESISIHAPLAGRDRARPYRCRWRPLFQSTRPLRGATCISACGRPGGKHFNPRAPCGARPGKTVQVSVAASISIHAPLAGRDLSLCALPSSTRNFNPRAPCGARRTAWTTSRPCANFNPRAPCGARLDRLLRVAIVAPISIHAPLAGRDRRAAPA